MIIKSKTKRAIVKEGTHVAKLASIKGHPSDSDPKKVSFGYIVEGYEVEVTKELPCSFEPGAPLRKDVETLLNRELTSGEAESGIELSNLIGTACQVVVAHKSGAGGKPKAVVSVIMAAPKANNPASI